MEFLQQIKSSADTAALYESIQQDTSLSTATVNVEPMELS